MITFTPATVSLIIATLVKISLITATPFILSLMTTTQVTETGSPDHCNTSAVLPPPASYTDPGQFIDQLHGPIFCLLADHVSSCNLN